MTLGGALTTLGRLVCTAAATVLFTAAILGYHSHGTLARGLYALAGGAILLLLAGAWLDVAAVLLVVLVVAAGLHVKDHEKAPVHARPTVLLHVSLEHLQVPVRSFRAGEAIVLVTVVRQRRRSLVHRHDVILRAPLCASRPPERILVEVERGKSDAVLTALARDAAISARSYAVATGPPPPTIAEEWTDFRRQLDAVVGWIRI
jgi:hypothetical protein